MKNISFKIARVIRDFFIFKIKSISSDIEHIPALFVKGFSTGNEIWIKIEKFKGFYRKIIQKGVLLNLAINKILHNGFHMKKSKLKAI